MPTKLSRFCEAVMESAWIVALVVAPVFFNIYSSRIFEPDKIALIRSLAIVVLVAWLVKVSEEGWFGLRQGKPSRSFRQKLLYFPLAIPVLTLVVAYCIATIFSVSARVSFWGSYQRLQGFYTTFSYLVIFLSVLGTLRQKVQIRRLITISILASLPVSLYGVIQRFGLDPIPWGGDVSVRVAANMGNSIFLAAYLIMVFPLTLIRIVESLELMLQGKGNSHRNFTRLTIYLFIAALQLTTLFYTGSRGPWLGWAASMVFIWLGFSLLWHKRWLSLAGIAVAVTAALFLVVLNIPAGPLENLRETAQFGRLGRLLDAGSRTGRVRELIWQGAAQLVLPHAPLEYPDGLKDRFNLIRPFIGYGLESMYVAYNPFYPPELTQVEKRNASPDRSHNETWDALVTTGLLGLVAYLLLFGSVIYFGSKWLGLVSSRSQRNLFIGLFVVGGLVSSGIFVIWKGIPYLGVALPFGMVLGFLLFLIWTALRGQYEIPETDAQKSRAYVLLGLLAALLAHFVEINFGIAIVSTRTYFWIYSGLLLCAGYILPLVDEKSSNSEKSDVQAHTSAPFLMKSEQAVKRPKPGRTNRPASRTRTSRYIEKDRLQEGSFSIFRLPDWGRSALMSGSVCAILLTTLGFLYLTNSTRSGSATGMILASLTRSGGFDPSKTGPGILMLVFSTGLAGMALLVTEPGEIAGNSLQQSKNELLKVIGIGSAIALALSLAFWFNHAHQLVRLSSQTANSIEEVISQVRYSENLLANFYLFQTINLILLAFSLVTNWPMKAYRRLANLGFVVLASASILVIVLFSNLKVVQADMAFKTAEIFAQPRTWPVAIRIYERANELAPNEDYYYLFLGRAYLEYARSLENPQERDRLMAQAARDLENAQQINPLNPDHTANLARLHSLWALTTSDPGQQLERAAISDRYFSRAVVLKPKDAKLWDEWALLNLNVLGNSAIALEQLNTSLEIDPFYDWTYGLLGDYTERVEVDELEPGTADRQSALEKAADYYKNALQYADANNSSLKLNYFISLAGIQVQLGQLEEAIANYELALDLDSQNPDNWKILETLARLYYEIGDQVNAVSKAVMAIDMAPDDQKTRLQQLLVDLQG